MVGEKEDGGKKATSGTHLSIPRLPDSFRRHLYSKFWCQFRSDEEIDDFWVEPWVELSGLSMDDLRLRCLIDGCEIVSYHFSKGSIEPVVYLGRED